MSAHDVMVTLGPSRRSWTRPAMHRLSNAPMKPIPMVCWRASVRVHGDQLHPFTPLSRHSPQRVRVEKLLHLSLPVRDKLTYPSRWKPQPCPTRGSPQPPSDSTV